MFLLFLFLSVLGQEPNNEDLARRIQFDIPQKSADIMAVEARLDAVQRLSSDASLQLAFADISIDDLFLESYIRGQLMMLEKKETVSLQSLSFAPMNPKLDSQYQKLVDRYQELVLKEIVEHRRFFLQLILKVQEYSGFTSEYRAQKEHVQIRKKELLEKESNTQDDVLFLVERENDLRFLVAEFSRLWGTGSTNAERIHDRFSAERELRLEQQWEYSFLQSYFGAAHYGWVPKKIQKVKEKAEKQRLQVDIDNANCERFHRFGGEQEDFLLNINPKMHALAVEYFSMCAQQKKKTEEIALNQARHEVQSDLDEAKKKRDEENEEIAKNLLQSIVYLNEVHSKLRQQILDVAKERAGDFERYDQQILDLEKKKNETAPAGLSLFHPTDLKWTMTK